MVIKARGVSCTNSARAARWRRIQPMAFLSPLGREHNAAKCLRAWFAGVGTSGVCSPIKLAGLQRHIRANGNDGSRAFLEWIFNQQPHGHNHQQAQRREGQEDEAGCVFYHKLNPGPWSPRRHGMDLKQFMPEGTTPFIALAGRESVNAAANPPCPCDGENSKSRGADTWRRDFARATRFSFLATGATKLRGLLGGGAIDTAAADGFRHAVAASPFVFCKKARGHLRVFTSRTSQEAPALVCSATGPASLCECLKVIKAPCLGSILAMHPERPLPVRRQSRPRNLGARAPLRCRFPGSTIPAAPLSLGFRFGH